MSSDIKTEERKSMNSINVVARAFIMSSHRIGTR